ncbi:MAG: hypothetical protein N2491_01050 [Negativicutes bacterium]|nr:hypothetical protein [Negativicutes bacterium]
MIFPFIPVIHGQTKGELPKDYRRAEGDIYYDRVFNIGIIPQFLQGGTKQE